MVLCSVNMCSVTSALQSPRHLLKIMSGAMRVVGGGAGGGIGGGSGGGIGGGGGGGIGHH
ncbi:hypothetical protein ACSBR1_031441 [Camellia fascicularis]